MWKCAIFPKFSTYVEKIRDLFRPDRIPKTATPVRFTRAAVLGAGLGTLHLYRNYYLMCIIPVTLTHLRISVRCSWVTSDL